MVVRLHIVNDEATGLTAGAVNERQHFVLVMEPTPFLHALGLDGFIVADKGFVHFHYPAASAEWREVAFPHCPPDPVRHEPRRLEGDTEHTV